MSYRYLKLSFTNKIQCSVTVYWMIGLELHDILCKPWLFDTYCYTGALRNTHVLWNVYVSEFFSIITMSVHTLAVWKHKVSRVTPPLADVRVLFVLTFVIGKYWTSNLLSLYFKYKQTTDRRERNWVILLTMQSTISQVFSMKPPMVAITACYI